MKETYLGGAGKCVCVGGGEGVEKIYGKTLGRGRKKIGDLIKNVPDPATPRRPT